MDQAQRNKCRNFLRNHDVGVIATASAEGEPHASVVNYYTNDKFEIFFIAREHAQKFHNIRINPSICIVVSDENFATSVEVKGTAEKLNDTPQTINILRQLADVVRRKHSGPLPIMKLPGSELHLFRLKPESIAYADFRPSHEHDGEYFEIEL